MNKDRDEYISRDDLNEVFERLGVDESLDAATIFEARDNLPVVKLELSRAEAETLAVVLANVGGDPETSPRGNLMRIMAELDNANVNWVPLTADPVYSHRGAVNFI